MHARKSAHQESIQLSYPPSGTFGAPAMPPTGPFQQMRDQQKRRNRTIALVAVVVVFALVLASVLVIVLRDKDGGLRIPGLSLLTSGEAGPDPFGPNVALTNKELPSNVKLASQSGAPDNGARVVSGTQPGLYAGGESTCDTAALGNYLANNPSQASAWASVFGISTASIPYYLNTLTPVVLTADTWVTNHSYQGGSAYAFQSVLQSGTAVLVDGAGVPRVRCACGNPLAPPAATPIGGYRLTGHPWHDYHSHEVTRIAYNTQNVTVVNNTTTVVNQAPQNNATPAATVLTLLNLATGQQFERPVGGIIDVSGLPPLTTALPTPAALNTPFVAKSDEAAAENGLARAGSSEPATEVAERAASNGGVPEGAPDSSQAPEQQQNAAASGTAGAQSEGSAASAAPSSSSSAQPSPTQFSGTGDAIGDFTFRVDDRSVSCQVPTSASTGSVDLTCSDGVTRTVSSSSLERSSVSSSTDPTTKVWKLNLIENQSSSVSVDVESATWRTAETSSTTTTTEATTTETTTPETTTETTTPETTTPETTIETTTPEETTTTTTTTEEVPAN